MIKSIYQQLNYTLLLQYCVITTSENLVNIFLMLIMSLLLICGKNAQYAKAI